MRRFTLVAMILAIELAAPAYIVCASIDLLRRGFAPTEIAIALGVPVALNFAAWCVIVTWIRRQQGAARN
jgi:hypothetical protein